MRIVMEQAADLATKSTTEIAKQTFKTSLGEAAGLTAAVGTVAGATIGIAAIGYGGYKLTKWVANKLAD